jgi:Mannosyltransferase (PIG-V)
MVQTGLPARPIAHPAPPGVPVAPPLAARLAVPPPGAGDDRIRALRDVWTGLWASRLAILAASIYAILTVGYRPTGRAPVTGAPLGDPGELIFGIAQRWDSGFYLSIAQHGYHTAELSAFFPLYPIAVRALSETGSPPQLAAIAVTLAAFATALYLLHRLTALELGEAASRPAVLALAFFPTAVFFSAIYPEALLLSLTLGAVYSARMGWWGRAGILGACAAATHNSGVLVAIPIGLLLIYGPRADRETTSSPKHTWLPRYWPGWQALWVALVPVGLIAYFGYLGVAHGDVWQSLQVNDTLWHRHFVPLGGLTGIPGVLGHSLKVIANAPPRELFPASNGPYRGAGVNLVDAAALAFALIATVGVLKRLPLAYGAYTVAALAVLTSAPKATEPLVSFPRYVLVLFPLQMWLGAWLHERGRLPVWLACSAIGLCAASIEFATGRWVA